MMEVKKMRSNQKAATPSKTEYQQRDELGLEVKI
jgi:hypothetical protein